MTGNCSWPKLPLRGDCELHLPALTPEQVLSQQPRIHQTISYSLPGMADGDRW